MAVHTRTAATRLLLVHGARVEFRYRYERFPRMILRVSTSSSSQSEPARLWPNSLSRSTTALGSINDARMVTHDTRYAQLRPRRQRLPHPARVGVERERGVKQREERRPQRPRPRSSACNACTLWFEAPRNTTGSPAEVDHLVPFTALGTPSTSTPQSSQGPARSPGCPLLSFRPRHHATPVPYQPPARF